MPSYSVNWTNPEPNSSDVIPYQAVPGFERTIDYAMTPLPEYLREWRPQLHVIPRFGVRRTTSLRNRQQVAGGWLIRKAKQWADAGSVYQAAKNLRKWNVPIELAMQLLAHR